MQTVIGEGSLWTDADPCVRHGHERRHERARARSRAPGGASLPAAGVSTLDAIAAGAPGAVPVIDAKRGEVFALLDGEPRCLKPDELELPSGVVCVGDGALRYRASLEEQGAVIPPDESDQHVPRARFHALLARDFGPAEAIGPLYLRLPDAERRRR